MNDPKRQHMVARLTEITLGQFRKVLRAEGDSFADEASEIRAVRRWSRWRDRLLYERSCDRMFQPDDLQHLADLLAREIMAVQLAHMTREVPDVIDFPLPSRQHA